MKKLLLSLIILSVSACLSAQTAKNPFEKYGYKKQVMFTSSKGEFEEFHDQTDIVEIGTVLFNTKTNKVIGFLNEETADKEVASSTAAMSIDPLCEKYYWISPYAYALNNPIKFVDPDGQIVKIANNAAGALDNLARIIATNLGQSVINRLISSNQTYTANSVFWTNSSKYDEKNHDIYYVGTPWISNFDGGSASSQIAMSHELFHAYQDETNQIRYYNEKISNMPDLESGAVSFENYIRQSYGDTQYRERYGSFLKGDFHQFSTNEKISNFTTLGNNSDKTSYGFSYTKTTTTAVNYLGNTRIPKETKITTSTYYVVVNVDKDKKFNYQIYTSEDAYKKAIANW
jgi:hypothetical protein